MKNLFLCLMFATALVFSSCGANQEVVDACADDMCKAIENYNPDDPVSGLSFIEGLTKIRENKDYENITESQLKEAMEKKCPEGAKKFEEIKNMAK